MAVLEPGDEPERRLADALGALLERRTSRRGVLARAALAGSAFAVAPVRYLIRPGTAWAVIRPGRLPAGPECSDGYTAFCCEIEAGRNTCPENTYVAGWWKCTDYQGSGLCHGQGYRYYLDCNRIPGHAFPGRLPVRAAATAPARGRLQPLPLRAVQHPGPRHDRGRLPAGRSASTRRTSPGLNCNGTEKVDNRTCVHEAGCLEGLAMPLPGGGGA